MPSHRAAWLVALKSPLEVRDAPQTRPGRDELVVAVRAVALNPLDWTIQVVGNLAYRWLDLPFVLGADLAGEVVEVGEDVTRFAVGDRVLALAEGTDEDSSSSARSAFQERAVVLERLTAPLPEAMSYEEGAVVPLALGTAASALFRAEGLGLQHPSATPAPTGRTLLVWGGSTSVGSAAIQLAVAAGYDVVSTASPRHHDHVRALGASQVLDYASPTVVADLVAALAGRPLAGALAVATGSARPCADVLAACQGDKRLSMASPAVSFAPLADVGRWSPRLLATMTRLVASTVALQVRCRVRGIRAAFVWGTDLKKDDLSRVVFAEFLPAALADGRYVPAPPPRVVGTGLESIQAGLDALRAGVSREKLVVTL